MARNRLFAALSIGAIGFGVSVGVGANGLLSASAEGVANRELKPAVSLPITRVVLFNSGVGYMSRSGEVVDDARVDLTFPESVVNDLLKSMTVEDFNGGRIAAVNYDSREPIARTLASFAIDLNGNPTFAAILSQVRGERVDVVVSLSAANQPGRLSGTIVGIEKRKVAQVSTTNDVEVLNLWCSEGLRSVLLTDVQQLKFANPVIESEFRRSLEVLAAGHDSQKKAVSLHFAGEGKRKVQVGYVVEAPIWKTSYRLVLADKEKPYLQGWAMVENTTDEDWTGVKMALISGRPIGFKMDLYNPLYVDRLIVEPELFASLRPVTYRGGFGATTAGFGGTGDPANEAQLRRLFERFQWLVKEQKFAEAEQVALQAKQLDPDNPAVAAMATMARLQRRVSDKGDKEVYFREGLNDAEREGPLLNANEQKPARPTLSSPYLNLVRSQPNDPNAAYAKATAAELGQRIAAGAVGNAATAASLGDFFQYSIDHPVSLPRQKSAMLPIVGKELEGQRVSIYNEFVLSTHPLLGLKFKNTSGLHLNQGPITVFEGSVYAGDTRVLDVQPNEERLVSYAIDLGMDVNPEAGAGTQKITSIKANKGLLQTTARLLEEKKYRIANRTQTDRTLLIEHPNRTNQKFRLVETDKPIEDTPDALRFQVSVKAGETKNFIVKEEKELGSSLVLANSEEGLIAYVLSLSEASASLKNKLKEAQALKSKWDASQAELKQVEHELLRMNADQERIRKNLRETPSDAEVYRTYLKKLSDQEKEIDLLVEKQKKLTKEQALTRKDYEDYLANLSD